MTDKMKGSAYILQKILREDMVKNAEMAIGLAEVLIRHRWDADTLKLQQPLSARDAEDRWVVEGTPNALDPSSQSGPVHIELNEADARILSFCFTLPREIREKFDKVRLQGRAASPKD
jgi:hypothetical protein